MQAGCYTLDLYCDAPVSHRHNAFPHQFTGASSADVRRQARMAGWRLAQPVRFRDACPKCVATGVETTSHRWGEPLPAPAPESKEDQ